VYPKWLKNISRRAIAFLTIKFVGWAIAGLIEGDKF
jgi:hypothetical protein